MKKTSKDISKLIREIRELCQKMDEIEKTIKSGLLNDAIQPEYLNERDRLCNELERMLTDTDEN